MGRFDTEAAVLIESYGTVCGAAASWNDVKGKQFQDELAVSIRACLTLKEAAYRADDALVDLEKLLSEVDDEE